MPDETYQGRDLEVLADMPNYYGWIMDTFAPHVRGVTVEYGAGTGTVSELLRPSAQSLTLIEPSENLIASLRSRFAAFPNVAVRKETLEAHVQTTPDNSVDTIVMVNVLEHVEDDRGALSQLHRMLTPGGHLLIFVPALEALMSKLDLMHGHFRRYHKPDLTGKVAETGAAVLSCRYFDLPGTAPWFILNRLLGATTFNPALVGLYDRVIVPLARAVEPRIPLPFGKNLILVARKS